MNTTGPYASANWANHNTMPCFHRTLTGVTDGTSNTIMVGTKALATNMYNQRGTLRYTATNGLLIRGDDYPITCADWWKTNPSSTTTSSPSAATVSHRWNWDGSMGKRGGRAAPDAARCSHV